MATNVQIAVALSSLLTTGSHDLSRSSKVMLIVWLTAATTTPSTKVNKLRKRLGWVTGILNDTGGKPKGMHWTTYWQLKGQHETILQVSLQDMGRKLGILHKMLGGKSVSKNRSWAALSDDEVRNI